jgi:hypothetical protein
MKIALLSIFLLFSTNPKVQTDKEHIGSFDVYMNDQNEIEVHYLGKYDKCFTLYLIKRVNSNCELQIDEFRLDSIFQFEPDTCIPTKTPIKTTRM